MKEIKFVKRSAIDTIRILTSRYYDYASNEGDIKKQLGYAEAFIDMIYEIIMHSEDESEAERGGTE